MVTSWSVCQRDVDEVREAVSSVLSGSGASFEHDASGLDDSWRALVANGYLFVPSDPGDGGTLAEALAVIEEAGRHGVRGPVAEHGVLAGWSLERVGLAVPDGPLTYAAARAVRVDGDRLWGTVARVPWAGEAHRIVLLLDTPAGPSIGVLDPKDARIEEGRNLAGESRDTVLLDGAAVTLADAQGAVSAEQLEARAALTRATLIAGAAARAVNLTLRYTRDRHQFGRPVGRFQAVQAHLVRAGQQVRVAQLAARSAALAMTFAPGGGLVEAAAAKVVCSHAAGVIAAATHQATGAIGMTKEYELGHLTLRLWSWRDECGTEFDWAQNIGDGVLAGGVDAFWPLVAGDATTAVSAAADT